MRSDLFLTGLLRKRGRGNPLFSAEWRAFRRVAPEEIPTPSPGKGQKDPYWTLYMGRGKLSSAEGRGWGNREPMIHFHPKEKRRFRGRKTAVHGKWIMHPSYIVGEEGPFFYSKGSETMHLSLRAILLPRKISEPSQLRQRRPGRMFHPVSATGRDLYRLEQKNAPAPKPPGIGLGAAQ